MPIKDIKSLINIVDDDRPPEQRLAGNDPFVFVRSVMESELNSIEYAPIEEVEAYLDQNDAGWRNKPRLDTRQQQLLADALREAAIENAMQGFLEEDYQRIMGQPPPARRGQAVLTLVRPKPETTP